MQIDRNGRTIDLTVTGFVDALEPQPYFCGSIEQVTLATGSPWPGQALTRAEREAAEQLLLDTHNDADSDAGFEYERDERGAR